MNETTYFASNVAGFGLLNHRSKHQMAHLLLGEVCTSNETPTNLYFEQIQGVPKKTPTTFRCHNSVTHWPIAFKFEHNVLWLTVDCCTNFYWIFCAQFQMVTTLIQAGQHSAFFELRALSRIRCSFLLCNVANYMDIDGTIFFPPPTNMQPCRFHCIPLLLHKHFPRVSEWACDVRMSSRSADAAWV